MEPQLAVVREFRPCARRSCSTRQKQIGAVYQIFIQKIVIIILIHLLQNKTLLYHQEGLVTITTSPVMWLASTLQGAGYLGESWGEVAKLIPYPALSIVSIARLSTELLKRGILIVPFFSNFSS